MKNVTSFKITRGDPKLNGHLITPVELFLLLCLLEPALAKDVGILTANAPPMTGNISYFASLTKPEGGNVTFRINGKGKIYDESTTSNSSLYINHMLYVKVLKD